MIKHLMSSDVMTYRIFILLLCGLEFIPDLGDQLKAPELPNWCTISNFKKFNLELMLLDCGIFFSELYLRAW